MTSKNAPLRVQLPSAKATRNLGAALANAACGQLLVLLKGQLGAGKTTFAQGVGEALGVTEIITSPTFTTLNEYHSGSAPLYHLDLYRLQNHSEGNSSAGLQFIADELVEFEQTAGLILIEWPDVLYESLQNREFVCVELKYDDEVERKADADAENNRYAVISAHGEKTNRIKEKLANIYFS